MTDTTQNPITDDNVTGDQNVLDSIEAIVEEVPAPGSTGASSDTDLIESLQASLARSQADYQNLLMRVDRDKADMVAFLSGKILLPLLTQVDNLERAVELKAGVEGDAFVDGVRSVLVGFERYLESQGVRAFDSLGLEVDPDRHDVMTQAPGPEGKIISVFEKGYTIGDRVLRHAKVVVGNGAA